MHAALEHVLILHSDSKPQRTGVMLPRVHCKARKLIEFALVWGWVLVAGEPVPVHHDAGSASGGDPIFTSAICPEQNASVRSQTTCDCSWTQKGRICATAVDDGSECFCRCCCIRRQNRWRPCRWGPVLSSDACDWVQPLERNDTMCAKFLDLPLHQPNCPVGQNNVPRIYHAVGKENDPPWTVRANMLQNPQFRLNYLNDSAAAAYIHDRCGHRSAQAYRCLLAPAYRADLFRFCALWAEGGIYIDTDLLALRPFEEMYSPCAHATVGHDYPQPPSDPRVYPSEFQPGIQMKILAAAPKSPLFGCMVDRIVSHTASRWNPGMGKRRVTWELLSLTGPRLLHLCYSQCLANADCASQQTAHGTVIDAVAVSYRDQRGGMYPYNGMVGVTASGDDVLLAYEVPDLIHFDVREAASGAVHYSRLMRQNRLYKTDCALRQMPGNVAQTTVTPQPWFADVDRWFIKRKEHEANITKLTINSDPNPPGNLCAREKGTCNCPGGKVTFGSGSRWSYPKFVRTSIRCSLANFVDPNRGVAKVCRCHLTTANDAARNEHGEKCAEEKGICRCPGGTVVYGEGTTWSRPKAVSSLIICGARTFSLTVDPHVRKICRCKLQVH